MAVEIASSDEMHTGGSVAETLLEPVVIELEAGMHTGASFSYKLSLLLYVSLAQISRPSLDLSLSNPELSMIKVQKNSFSSELEKTLLLEKTMHTGCSFNVTLKYSLYSQNANKSSAYTSFSTEGPYYKLLVNQKSRTNASLGRYTKIYLDSGMHTGFSVSYKLTTLLFIEPINKISFFSELLEGEPFVSLSTKQKSRSIADVACITTISTTRGMSTGSSMSTKLTTLLETAPNELSLSIFEIYDGVPYFGAPTTQKTSKSLSIEVVKSISFIRGMSTGCSSSYKLTTIVFVDLASKSSVYANIQSVEGLASLFVVQKNGFESELFVSRKVEMLSGMHTGATASYKHYSGLSVDSNSNSSSFLFLLPGVPEVGLSLNQKSSASFSIENPITPEILSGMSTQASVPYIIKSTISVNATAASLFFSEIESGFATLRIESFQSSVSKFDNESYVIPLLEAGMHTGATAVSYKIFADVRTVELVSYSKTNFLLSRRNEGATWYKLPIDYEGGISYRLQSLSFSYQTFVGMTGKVYLEDGVEVRGRIRVKNYNSLLQSEVTVRLVIDGVPSTESTFSAAPSGDWSEEVILKTVSTGWLDVKWQIKSDLFTFRVAVYACGHSLVTVPKSAISLDRGMTTSFSANYNVTIPFTVHASFSSRFLGDFPGLFVNPSIDASNISRCSASFDRYIRLEESNEQTNASLFDLVAKPYIGAYFSSSLLQKNFVALEIKNSAEVSCLAVEKTIVYGELRVSEKKEAYLSVSCLNETGVIFVTEHSSELTLETTQASYSFFEMDFVVSYFESEMLQKASSSFYIGENAYISVTPEQETSSCLEQGRDNIANEVTQESNTSISLGVLLFPSSKVKSKYDAIVTIVETTYIEIQAHQLSSSCYELDVSGIPISCETTQTSHASLDIYTIDITTLLSVTTNYSVLDIFAESPGYFNLEVVQKSLSEPEFSVSNFLETVSIEAASFVSDLGLITYDVSLYSMSLSNSELDVEVWVKLELDVIEESDSTVELYPPGGFITSLEQRSSCTLDFYMSQSFTLKAEAKTSAHSLLGDANAISLPTIQKTLSSFEMLASTIGVVDKPDIEEYDGCSV